MYAIYLCSLTVQDIETWTRPISRYARTIYRYLIRIYQYCIVHTAVRFLLFFSQLISWMLVATYNAFSSTILTSIWISIAVTGDTASSKISFILMIKSKAAFLDSKQSEKTIVSVGRKQVLQVMESVFWNCLWFLRRSGGVHFLESSSKPILLFKCFNAVNRNEWSWRNFNWTLCSTLCGNGDLIILSLTSEKNVFPVAVYKGVEYNF